MMEGTHSSRNPVEARSLASRVSPRYTVAVVGVIIVICAAGAAWWSWRFVSLELTAAFGEGFRTAGLPEG
jgi:hypothetical protein